MLFFKGERLYECKSHTGHFGYAVFIFAFCVNGCGRLKFLPYSAIYGGGIFPLIFNGAVFAAAVFE